MDINLLPLAVGHMIDVDAIGYCIGQSVQMMA
jgi:hypothetical protein